MSRVSVIGGGAWGTALAIQAHRAGNHVTLHTRSLWPARTSPHLPNHPLPPEIDLRIGMPTQADAIILAIPVQHLRAAIATWPANAPLLVCAKGVETARLRLPLEILAETHPGAQTAILSGPNFAHEVAVGLPAAAVIAATDPALRGRLIHLLGSPTFRLYGNTDTIGVQVGGAAKNVIAIAAGAVMGAGLGENARAALITRGLAELARLVTAEGGRATTITGLSGLGDLLLTCTGPSSRNYRCGFALGQGEQLATILSRSDGVIEGVATAPALIERAWGLDLPVCATVAALLAGRTTLQQAIPALMARPTRDE